MAPWQMHHHCCAHMRSLYLHLLWPYYYGSTYYAPPLLRPHEEHVPRLEAPGREARVLVPQLAPHTRVLAMLSLQLVAEGLRGEDEVVADAQLLEVGQ